MAAQRTAPTAERTCVHARARLRARVFLCAFVLFLYAVRVRVCALVCMYGTCVCMYVCVGSGAWRTCHLPICICQPTARRARWQAVEAVVSGDTLFIGSVGQRIYMSAPPKNALLLTDAPHSALHAPNDADPLQRYMVRLPPSPSTPLRAWRSSCATSRVQPPPRTLVLCIAGRTDLPGSDQLAMLRSMLQLADLPDSTLVFPGHNYAAPPHSTIAEERANNPWPVVGSRLPHCATATHRPAAAATRCT